MYTPNNQDILNSLGGGTNFSFNPGVNNISTPTNMSANLGFNNQQPNLTAQPMSMQAPSVHPAMLPNMYAGSAVPRFSMPNTTPYLGNSGPNFMSGMFGRPNG